MTSVPGWSSVEYKDHFSEVILLQLSDVLHMYEMLTSTRYAYKYVWQSVNVQFVYVYVWQSVNAQFVYVYVWQSVNAQLVYEYVWQSVNTQFGYEYA